MVIYSFRQYINQKRIKFRSILVFKRHDHRNIYIHSDTICTSYLPEVMIKIRFSFPSVFFYQFKHNFFLYIYMTNLILFIYFSVSQIYKTHNHCRRTANQVLIYQRHIIHFRVVNGKIILPFSHVEIYRNFLF